MFFAVDADQLVYAAGFAVQKTLYDYTVVDENDALVDMGIAERDEFKAIEAMCAEGLTVTHSLIVEPEPLENALHIVKSKLSGFLPLDRFSYQIYLTGKDNFRDKIATIRKYKGNRDPSHKPYWYKEIREYLVQKWEAGVIDGWEADDQVTMEAYQFGHDTKAVTICSPDKDLRTVPGRLYNYATGETEIISEQEALINFYRQILTGDTVDNIPGCYKVGEVRAAKLITEDMTERGMYETCLEQYQASLQKPGCPYKILSAEEALLENAQLLHMLRYPNQVWEIPKCQ